LRTAVQSELRSTLLRGADLFASARRGDGMAAGWHYTDPEILEAEGGRSGAFCDILLALLMPKLDGLPDRMHSLDATVLDVGTGSGQTAIELCRRLPDVRV